MASISGSGIGSAGRTEGSATSRARIAVLLAVIPVLLGAAPIARLDVAIDHLRSAKGLIRVCLTADPDNFPADAITRSVPAGVRDIRFAGLPYGHYAVAVIHDENGNAKLDTFAGIPREGFGFSRNPSVGFGPPRFAAARFAIAGDAETQQIRMRYIF